MRITAIETISALFKGPANTVGVDVGSYALKVIYLAGAAPKYTIAGWGYLPLEIETSFEQSQAELKGIYASKLSMFLNQNRALPKEATTGIDGPSLIVRTISIPRLAYQELTKTIGFEAEPFLPVNINDCEIGFHIVGPSKDDPKKMDVLIAAVKKDYIESKIALLNDASLRTVVADANAFALYNAYETVSNPSEIVVILNVGASVTNMVLVDNMTVKMVRDLAYGGIEFTKNIQRQMTVDFNGAENLKMAHGILVSGDDKERTLADDKKEALGVSMALNNSTKMLVGDIHRFLEFYLGQNPDAVFSRILLSGGTAGLPNLAAYVAKETNIPTEIFNPIARCEGANLIPEKFQPSLATAFGLAMRREKDHLATGKKVAAVAAKKSK
ncbi:MAG: type IV pilus assembly protein PilM [Endomicrobiia bacterium]|nr:type IV pilus assembly protein PilM [Endomicrobiia bacterium]